VDGGFTCPNRDGKVGWGGCIYCSNESFRPVTARVTKSIEQQLQDGISFLRNRYQAEKFIVYWQNFTNTYAPVDELHTMFLRALQADPRIVGMAVGTRADCVEDDTLEMMRLLADHYYVCLEYGLESIHDSTLRLVNRGHDLACFVDAVGRTKQLDLPISAHVILGFPNESKEERMAYAPFLNQLDLDFVKIHHLHIVAGTALAKQYANQPFPLYSLDEWVQAICDFLELLSPDIVVQRLFGWAPDRRLIAPRWHQSKAAVRLAISTELEKRDSWQGKALAGEN